jgi:fructose-specific phosphotransferase system IIC component
MKTVAISSNSWHYRWMSKMDIEPSSDNICAYTRAMLKTLGLTFLLSMLAGLITASFGDFLAWIAAMIMSWQVFMYHDVAVFAVVIISFVALGLICLLVKTINNSASTVAPLVPEDIKSMWDSIHNKICARTKIVYDDNA